MTTNQTIYGVPRELLERVTKPLTIHDDLTDRIKARDELRTLLDAERCTSCDDSGDLTDLTGEWRGYCVCPIGVALKNKPAARPQGEPVALLSKGFTTLETGDGKYRIITQYKNRDDAWSDYTALCKAEQPAPVAVAPKSECPNCLGDAMFGCDACTPDPVAVVLPECLTAAELEELEVIEAFIHGQGLSNLAGTMAAARQFIDEVTRLNPSL